MSSYTEITETALVVKSKWSNKAVMQFHYFNPNGLVAAKKRIDEQINKLVDQGKCQPGAIFAYGALDRYAAGKIADLAMKKRVGRIESKVAIKMMMDDIAEAEKFIGEIMEETKKATLLYSKAAEKETPEAVEEPVEANTTHTLYTEDNDHEIFHTEFPSLYQVAKLHSGGFFRVLAQDSASKDDVHHLLLRTPKGNLWYPIEQVSLTL